MKAAGMDPVDYDEPIANIRRDVQKHKRATGAGLGRDYSELNDDQLTDDYHYTIFPNLSLNLHADDFWVFRQRPHATDPNKMYYDIWTYELVPQGKEWPHRAKHQTWKHGDKSIGLVLDQDAANLPNVQAGMHSQGLSRPVAGRQELRIRHFHKVIDDYLFPPRHRNAMTGHEGDTMTSSATHRVPERAAACLPADEAHPRVRGAAAHRDRHRRNPGLYASVRGPGGDRRGGVRAVERLRTTS